MTLVQFFNIVEIRTKIVSVSTFTIAVLYTFYATGRFLLLNCLLMGAATLLVDMGTTAFNIFYDYWRGVDHSDHNREKEKVLVHEGVAPGAAFLAAAGLYTAAGILGAVLALLTGWEVLAAGGLSMAVGFFYTGGPKPISRTPMGELFAGGFLGTVLFLITWFVMAGHMEGIADFAPQAAAASLPSFFLIASILTVNNTCDIEGDAAAGRRTFSIIAGRRAGEAAVYILGLLGFGSGAVLGLTGVLPEAAVPAAAAAGLLSAPVYISMHRRGFTHATKGPSMEGISKVFILYTLAMWGALAAGIIMPGTA